MHSTETGLIKPNVHAQWHPLKTVMLGDVFAPEWFEPIKDSELRDVLQRIAAESQEDLNRMHKELTRRGIRVIRPEQIPGDTILNYMWETQFNQGALPRPPLCPRDVAVTLGNRLLWTQRSRIPMMAPLNSAVDPQYIDLPLAADILGRTNQADDLWDHFDAPSVTRVGQDLYVDSLDHPNLPGWIKRHYPEYRVHDVRIGGHNDACFSPVKPGLILSITGLDHYEHTFPGWEVCYLEGQSWAAVDGWMQLKNSNSGRWWIPGEHDNKKLIDFCNTWLNDWVGFVEETVFDVNCLVIDEETVWVNNYNEQAFKTLARHGMRAEVMPWRHRYFWDGGLHCVTLDIEREGSREDYFPQMKDPWRDL